MSKVASHHGSVLIWSVGSTEAEDRMKDVLIRGGSVIDGTGAPAVEADVRVKDGRIAEVGPRLRRDGETEIDARQAVVTPGFVDSHTHFDPSVFWDPSVDPMPQVP